MRTRKELSRFVTIEESGWKEKKGTSILRSPDLLTFYSALTQQLAKAGWLEWHFLKRCGAPLPRRESTRLTF
jgi:hypothetical protein